MSLDPAEFAELVTTAIKAANAPLLARIVALEARAAVPGRDGRDGAAGVPGEKGLDGKPGTDGTPGRDGRDGARGSVGDKGRDGVHGKDGVNGRDGTLEHLKVMYDGERTVTLCFKDGTAIDGGVLVFPIPLDRGVYVAGKTYDTGDGVTYGGSYWITPSVTSGRPGDGASPWRLAVKHGREGKPGLNGKDGVNGRDLTGELRRY